MSLKRSKEEIISASNTQTYYVASSSARICQTLFIAVCFGIIPFIFTRSAIDPVFHLRFIALSFIIFIISSKLLLILLKKRDCFDFSIWRRPPFVFSALYVLSSTISLTGVVNLAEAIFEWLKIGMFISFFFISSQILQKTKSATCVLINKSIILIGGMLSAIGISQHYQFAFISIPGNFKIYATMVNKNLFASSLFLTLPYIFYGIFIFRKGWRIVSVVSFILALFAVLLSETRTVWAAVILSTVAVFIMACQIKLEFLFSKKTRMKHIFFGVATLLLLGVFCWQKSNYQTFNSTASLKERGIFWMATLKMITSAPFFGVGPGQWKIMIPLHGYLKKQMPAANNAGESIEVSFQRPHNDFLWIVAESGIIGFTFYMLMIAVIFYYSVKILRGKADPDKKMFVLSVFAGLIGYMLISFFSFPKERIFHSMMFTLMMSNITAVYHQIYPFAESKSLNSKQAAVCIMFIIIPFFAIFVGLLRFDSECKIKKALQARSDENWHDVISFVDNIYPRIYTMDPASMPVFWYRGMAYYSLGNFEKAKTDFENALKHHPNNIHVLNNLGICYAMLNDDFRAAELFRKALKIYPGFTEAKKNLSELKKITQ